MSRFIAGKTGTRLACGAMVCTMGIGFPLRWLEAAAAPVVNVVGCLLFAGLDFKRPLCLVWVRALASALIIFSSSCESSERSLRLYSRMND